MQQAVEDRRGDNRVAEDRAPFAVAFVGSQDDAAPFVTRADQLEEDRGTELIQRQVSHGIGGWAGYAIHAIKDIRRMKEPGKRPATVFSKYFGAPRLTRKHHLNAGANLLSSRPFWETAARVLIGDRHDYQGLSHLGCYHSVVVVESLHFCWQSVTGRDAFAVRVNAMEIAKLSWNGGICDLRGELLDALSRNICAQRLAVEALLDFVNTGSPDLERRYIEAQSRASKLHCEYHAMVRRVIGSKAYQ